jgi:tellurite resistance protein TehA-like permease
MVQCLQSSGINSLADTAAVSIVCGSTGAVVASALIELNPNHAWMTIVVSYALMGVGIGISLFFLCLYIYRLAIHKLPPKDVLVSGCLPLGSMGQGGFGILNLGSVCIRLSPLLATANSPSPNPNFPSLLSIGHVGETLYMIGFVVALSLWACGIWWMFLAGAGLVEQLLFGKGGIPFSIGWCKFL